MANSDSRGIKLDAFLTPEAMLTPGVAGSTIMGMTNVLAPTFALPHAWIALALSFLVGLLVLRAELGPIVKAVLYVLNSLVIFTVAFGTNSTGLAVDQRQLLSLGIVTPAVAQDIRDIADLQSRVITLNEQYDEVTAEIDAAVNSNASAAEIDALLARQKQIEAERTALIAELFSVRSAPPKSTGTFFTPWKF